MTANTKSHHGVALCQWICKSVAWEPKPSRLGDLEGILIPPLRIPPPVVPTTPHTVTLNGHIVIQHGQALGPQVTVDWSAGGPYHGPCNELVHVTTQAGCFAGLQVHTAGNFPLNQGSADDHHGTPLNAITGPGAYVADQLFLGNGNVIPNSGFRIARTVIASPVPGSQWQLTVTITPMAVANVPYLGAVLNAAAGQGAAVNWVHLI